jgi:dipeptidyl-peptidase-4
MRLALPILCFCTAAFTADACCGQSNGDREFLKQYAATYRFSLGHPAAIKITRDGDAILFLRSGPRSFVRDLYEFDVAKGTERLLASAEQILQGKEEELTAEELARRERSRLAARGIAAFDVSGDGRRVLVPLSGSLYVLERASGKSRELKSTAGVPIDARLSPDGNSIACVREGDLYVMDIASGAEQRLTQGASETLTRGLAEFVAQEEMSRMHGYWWSPDSQWIVYQETDTSDVEKLYIADPARPSQPPQDWRYPRPGKSNAHVRLGIIPVVGGETTWIEWDRGRFPYLAAVSWALGWDSVPTRSGQSPNLPKDRSPLTILVQNRQQTEEVLLAVDPTTGRTIELLTETDPDWINLDDAMPHWLLGGRAFLWSTERSGAWQLELRSRSGDSVATLTPLELGYRGLLGVDEGRGVAFVSGGPNPTETHIYRVPLDPNAHTPEQITDKPGTHWAVFSERGGASVRTRRTVSIHKNRFQVYRGDGSLAGELVSVAEQPPFVPQVELTAVGGELRLHAAMVRPRDFDAKKRYPVIVNVYGGPHGQMVAADGERYLLHQWIADHGFIVVSIDGRGTPARGRLWERAIKGNLIELPLDDQVHGLQALGESNAEMDLSRVGIYGWSFGGYLSAMAVMQRPDVFHVGVAGAPVVDWHDYDTHYTERYLGLPAENEAGYQASSVLTHASKLTRPLLVIHGTADDNVYFLHSMKLCDALFRAGKPYDFLPLAGFTHMVPDPLITERLYGRIVEYFVEHLQAR